MDLRQLEMFVAVAEQGGFCKAAAKLYVSQSAISRKVGLLEHELGQKLFLRLGSGTILTGVGEAVLRQSRIIFRQINITKMEIFEIGQLQRGELRIGASMSACAYILPPVFKLFREAFPLIELIVVSPPFDTILSLIKNGRLDLAVVTLPIQNDDVSVTELLTEEMVVVVSCDHPLHKYAKISASELSQYPMILLTKDTNTRQIFDMFFHELGVTPNIAMELPNFAAIKPLVQTNLGISILSLESVRAEIKNGSMHALRIKERLLHREIGLVRLNSDYQPPAVTQMIDCFLKTHQSDVNDPGSPRSRVIRVSGVRV
jgi:DNA-binding transcriptional LysR family regulator